MQNLQAAFLSLVSGELVPRTYVSYASKPGKYSSALTLFTPAYFGISGTRGGTLCPPKVSWGWVGLGFQFFLEMTYQWMIDHIQKDSGSLDA